mmetsp:Transcript_86666/g.197795  ORF Transcript_86666/g.197795 Transcript_86666/m.197795 type:complete len:591 (+) Transcript_86666:41-1813(+)
MSAVGHQLSSRSDVQSASPVSRWMQKAISSRGGTSRYTFSPMENSDEFVDPPWILGSQAGLMFGVMIMLNVVVLGFETDYRDEDSPTRQQLPWMITEGVFLLVFTVEVFMRTRVRGTACVKDPWDIFDFLLVICGLLALAFDIVALGNQASSDQRNVFGLALVLRSARVLKIFRVARIIRLFRFFTELFLLARGIFEAMRSLLWIMLFTLMILYVAAIFLTRLISDQEQLSVCTGQHQAEVTDCTLTELFGTVPASMFTLFHIMTLEQWPFVARAATDAEIGGYPWLWIFFVAFVCFTNFTLLNLVTGVAVESVMTIAHEGYRNEDLVRAHDMLRERTMQVLTELFKDADTNDSGSLNRGQFLAVLDSPVVREQLAKVNVAVKDAELLFDILDRTQDGEVMLCDYENHFMSVMLNPVAQSVSLLSVQLDIERQSELINTLIDEMDDHIERTADQLETRILESLDELEDYMGRDDAGLDPFVLHRDLVSDGTECTSGSGDEQHPRSSAAVFKSESDVVFHAIDAVKAMTSLTDRLREDLHSTLPGCTAGSTPSYWASEVNSLVSKAQDLRIAVGNVSLHQQRVSTAGSESC